MRHSTDLWLSDVRNAYILVVVSNSNGINKKRSPLGIRRKNQLPSWSYIFMLVCIPLWGPSRWRG